MTVFIELLMILVLWQNKISCLKLKYFQFYTLGKCIQFNMQSVVNFSVFLFMCEWCYYVTEEEMLRSCLPFVLFVFLGPLFPAI